MTYSEWFAFRVEKRGGAAVFKASRHHVAGVGYSAVAFKEREGRDDHETVARYYGIEPEDVKHAVTYWRSEGA